MEDRREKVRQSVDTMPISTDSVRNTAHEILRTETLRARLAHRFLTAAQFLTRKDISILCFDDYLSQFAVLLDSIRDRRRNSNPPLHIWFETAVKPAHNDWCKRAEEGRDHFGDSPKILPVTYMDDNGKSSSRRL